MFKETQPKVNEAETKTSCYKNKYIYSASKNVRFDLTQTTYNHYTYWDETDASAEDQQNYEKQTYTWRRFYDDDSDDDDAGDATNGDGNHDLTK
jgi:hypothetical protein